MGKTALAIECALKAGFTFTKLINSDRFIGFNEQQTMAEIVHIFEDAEKCPLSFILLDDVIRLVDYVPLGQKFNSSILNLILNLLKKNLSNPNSKQIILATVGP